MRTFNSNTIVNIVRAEVTTLEDEPRVLSFDTVTSAEPEPVVSEGEDSELRVRNTILAQDTLEDILKGYDITLKDCVLSAELLALIDGGSVVEAGNGTFAGYRSPAAGSTSSRTRFILRLYTEEKDYSGEAVGYFRFSFPNCVGTPAKFEFENGTFTAPEYTVRSRPSAGKSALSVECIDRLPIYCATADDVPVLPESGDCVTAIAAITAGELALTAGQTAYYDGSEWNLIA